MKKSAKLAKSILDDFESGDPGKVIAARYGVSKAYVSKVANRSGARRYKPRRHHTTGMVFNSMLGFGA